MNIFYDRDDNSFPTILFLNSYRQLNFRFVRTCGQRRQYLEQRLLHDSYVYMLCKVEREARKIKREN
jgi:hypothetical protein